MNSTHWNNPTLERIINNVMEGDSKSYSQILQYVPNNLELPASSFNKAFCLNAIHKSRTSHYLLPRRDLEYSVLKHAIKMLYKYALKDPPDFLQA